MLSVILVSFVLLLYYFYVVKKYPRVKVVLFFALVLRIALLIIYQYIGEDDPDNYIGRATVLYDNYGGLDFLKNIQLNAYFYSWLMAGVWKITGVNYMVIGLINTLLSFTVCVKAYELSNKLGGQKYSKRILCIVAFFPMLIRFSSTIVSREILFVLFLVLFLERIYDYYVDKKTKDLLSALLFCVLMTVVHTTGLVFFLFPVLLFAVPNFKKRGRLMGAFTMIVLIFLGVLFMINNSIGTAKFSIGADRYSSWDQVEFIQESSASGRAQYLNNLHAGNLAQYLLYLPVRMIYFMFAPFPWMVSSPVDLLGVLDSLLYVYLIFKVIKKRKNKMDRYLRCLGVCLIAFIIMMASAVSNYGTAMRHRQKIVIPLSMIAYSSFVIRDDKKEKEEKYAE